jgi:hypothetical protein
MDPNFQRKQRERDQAAPLPSILLPPLPPDHPTPKTQRTGAILRSFPSPCSCTSEAIGFESELRPSESGSIPVPASPFLV